MTYWPDASPLLPLVHCSAVLLLREYDFLDEPLDADDEGERCDLFFPPDGLGGAGEEAKEEAEGLCQ